MGLLRMPRAPSCGDSGGQVNGIRLHPVRQARKGLPEFSESQLADVARESKEDRAQWMAQVAQGKTKAEPKKKKKKKKKKKRKQSELPQSVGERTRLLEQRQ